MWVLVLFGLLMAIGLRREPRGSRDSALAATATILVLAYVSVRGQLL
jgi:hypothetical protein